jgi:hypothetical protein
MQRHMPSMNVFSDGDPEGFAPRLVQDAAMLALDLVQADEPICLYERFEHEVPGGCIQYDLVYHAGHRVAWSALEAAVARYVPQVPSHVVLLLPHPVFSLGLRLETEQVRVNIYGRSPAAAV